MGNNPGGATFSGCASNPLAPTSGVATFTRCHLNAQNVGYTFTAASGSLTGATSNPFNVTGTASKLVFTTQPGGGIQSTVWPQQPVVSVQDSSSRVVTADSGSVALTIKT